MSEITEQEAKDAIGNGDASAMQLARLLRDGKQTTDEFSVELEMLDKAWGLLRGCFIQELARRAAERRHLPNAVKQTTPTNCFAACVAMLLQTPIEEVRGVDGAAWNWTEFQEWLGCRGLQAIEMTFQNGGTLYPIVEHVPCILSGESPRHGRLHAVCGMFTGLDFKLTHDPHESNEWIDGEPTHATFFVETQAAKSRRAAELAEREKPIDAEWCLANGAAWNNHRAVAWWRILDNSRLEFSAANGVALIVGDGWAYVDHVTTRGQLLDLLRALKGGAT